MKTDKLVVVRAVITSFDAMSGRGRAKVADGVGVYNIYLDRKTGPRRVTNDEMDITFTEERSLRHIAVRAELIVQVTAKNGNLHVIQWCFADEWKAAEAKAADFAKTRTARSDRFMNKFLQTLEHSQAIPVAMQKSVKPKPFNIVLRPSRVLA